MDLPLDKPIAGLLAPLFAIRTEHDLGIGDTEGLKQLIDWAAGIGFSLVQLLPINETGNDNSPYNAIHSVAIDPATIAISPKTVRDLSREDFDGIVGAADMAKIRSGPVDYRAVKALKRALLWRAFQNFTAKSARQRGARGKDFTEFKNREAGWLEGYALYRLLMEENGTECWTHWPEGQRSPASAEAWIKAQDVGKREELESKREFYKYIQWIAFEQWRALREYANTRAVALMGDVPFGISYYSGDVYSQPENFDLKWSGGAPPEPYFKDDEFTQKWGQNWGVPLYRWDVMQRSNFAWWRQRVRMVRAIFNLFRVDHVLGFYRIYCFPWRPEKNGEFLHLSHDEARAKTNGELPRFMPRDDSNWQNAEENRKTGEHYLRMLLEEVGEHRLIGEDLGHVPDYVRPNLTQLGIPGFKIPIWETRRDGGGLTPGRDYQRLSVTTYATHDHEPLKALWERWLRTIREHDKDQEAQDSLREMQRLAEFAGLPGPFPTPWSDQIHEKLLQALVASNSWIAVFMITDLFATAQRFNVPGSVAESNWSQRLPQTVKQWKTTNAIKAKMARVQQILVGTQRTPGVA